MAEVRYSLNTDDYIEYNEWLVVDNPDFKKKLQLRRLAVAGIVLGFGVLYAVLTGTYAWVVMLIALAGAALMYALFPKVLRAGQKRAVIQYVQKDKDKDCFLEQTVTVDADSVTIATAQVKKTYKLEDVTGLFESAHLYYIQLADGQLMIIPMRAFENGADREAFVGALKK